MLFTILFPKGSACVGLKSKTHAVIATLMRSSSELGSYQKKILRIDDHMGIAIAGLIGTATLLSCRVVIVVAADARVLSKYMRSECLNHKFVYDAPLQTQRLVSAVADST